MDYIDERYDVWVVENSGEGEGGGGKDGGCEVGGNSWFAFVFLDGVFADHVRYFGCEEFLVVGHAEDLDGGGEGLRLLWVAGYVSGVDGCHICDDD